MTGILQLETLRVLHIDDDADDHFIVRSMLSEAQGRNFSLDWAANLDEGRQKLSANHYQAVLVDYDLGLGTGIDLIREFVGREYASPLILLTGRGSYEVDMEAMHAGATLYLTKDEINPLLLERAIRYAIELKSKERELREARQTAERELGERRRAEEALRFSEERFRDLANHITQLAWIADETGWIFWFNQRWFEFTGTTLGEMQGWGWQKVHHPDHVQRVVEKVSECFRTGQFWEDTFPLRGADGAYRWFLSRAVPIKDEQGKVVRWFGTNTDVTEQRELQEQLEEQNEILLRSEERFSRAFESNPAGLALTQVSDGRFLDVNDSFCQIFGYSRAEMIGRTPAELNIYDPAVREKLLVQLQEQGRLRNEEMVFRARSGELRHLLFSVELLDTSAQQVLLSSCIDISKRKHAEEALRQSETKTREILESISDGFFAFDRQWRVTYMNQRAAEQGGRQAEDLIGTVIWESEPQLSKTPLAAVYKRVMDEHRAGSFEFFSQRTGRWIQLNVYPSADGISVYSVDITERKQAEEALSRLESRWNAAIESFAEGAIIATEDEQVIYWNPAAQEMHGFTRPDEGLQPLQETPITFQLWTPDGSHLLELDEWPMRRIKRGETVRSLELRIRRPDQGWEKVFSYSGAMVDTTGGERLIFLTCHDLTEQRRVEEALRQSEVRFGKAFNAAPYALVISRVEDGKIEQVNEAFEQLFGYARAEVLGKTSLELSMFANAEDREKAIQRLKAEGFLRDYELDIRQKSGEIRQAQLSVELLEIEASRFLMTVIEDVTEQKRAEAALRESEMRLSQLADAMPQLVWTALPDGSVDYYNQRSQLYDGVNQVEHDRWEWGPVLHPDDLQSTVEAWSRAVESGETYQIEHRIRMADGSCRWHLSRGIPARDEQGQLVKWYGTATDIHDFKAIQEALRQREQRLRRLFESNLIGIVTRDAAGRVLEANEAYLKIVGAASGEVDAGLLNEHTITPLEYRHLDEDCTAQVAASGFCRAYEKEYLARDGTRIPVLVGYSRLEGEQPELIGFVLDLSELKQAQAELLNYAQKLKHSNEELEHFAFMASHDLQEPLRKVQSFGKNLRLQLADQLTEEAEDTLNRMQNAAARMQTMINGLLDLSRVNTRGSDFERVRLTATAREVVEDLEAQFEKTGGRVVLGDLPDVQGDPLQLRQLLENLFGNALKYHREGVPPVIEVTGEIIQEGKVKLVRLVVTDNGAGFDETQAEKIFQPFIRLHGRKYAGSGIGLAICRKIVERHGGSITARSWPGEGSRFIITLPAWQQ